MENVCEIQQGALNDAIDGLIWQKTSKRMDEHDCLKHGDKNACFVAKFGKGAVEVSKLDLEKAIKGLADCLGGV